MLEPIYTKRFRKQLKLAEKRGRDLDKLGEVMKILVNEQPLPPMHENHPLHGKHLGEWECHVEPDWLLEYRVARETNEMIFYRTRAPILICIKHILHSPIPVEFCKLSSRESTFSYCADTHAILPFPRQREKRLTRRRQKRQRCRYERFSLSTPLVVNCDFCSFSAILVERKINLGCIMSNLVL